MNQRGKVVLWVGLGLVAAGVLAFGYTFIPQTKADTTVSGWQLRAATWRGTIRVTGDVLVLPWLTLTIEPGTRVLFEKKPDVPGTDWTEFADAYIKDHDDQTGREGYGQSHYDLAAKMIALGTTEQPIVFTSAQAQPEYADWDQLVLFNGSRLYQVEVSYAHNGSTSMDRT